MRRFLLLACFGVAQTYFLAQKQLFFGATSACSLHGMFPTFCSAIYVILISHVSGPLYLSQRFCFRSSLFLCSKLVQYSHKEVLWFYGPSTIRNYFTMHMCRLSAICDRHDLTTVKAGT